MSDRFHGVIYLATNRINGKVYIGQTVQRLNARIAQHLYSMHGIFPKALRKYGLDSFEFSVIESGLTGDEMNEREKYWIQYHNCMVPNGYNLADGGSHTKYILSDDQRKIISERTTKKLLTMWKDPEYRKRQTERVQGEQNPSKDPEVKQKISAKLKGRDPVWCRGKRGPMSEETKKKISESKKGHKCPSLAEWNIKRAGIKRKPLSEEHKRKIGESNRRHNAMVASL